MPTRIRAAVAALALMVATGGDAWTRAPARRALSRRDAGATDRSLVQTDATPAGLSADDWRQMQKAMREADYHAAYGVGSGGRAVLVAANRAQGYRTTFRREGIELARRTRASAWRVTVSLKAYGYAGEVRPLPAAEPRAEKDRIEYVRGPVTEWYVNSAGGLEQGFTIAEPRTKKNEPTVLALAVGGDLAARVEGNDTASFRDRGGRTRLRYAGLSASDAEGRPLASHLDASEGELRLIVSAQDARFPITVDPTFALEAALEGHGDDGVGQAYAEAGTSVAVSGDTAVVGAPGESAAHVFVRSGAMWSEQQKLVGDADSFGSFGSSVSIDGDTAVVGAPQYSATVGGAGAAYVFVRSGATWSLQQILVSPNPTSLANLGTSVVVSGDTVLAGAPGEDAVHVFVRSGTVWSEPQTLTGSGGPGESCGQSVSLSGDTAVVGAPQAQPGAAYVFVRSGNTWGQQQRLVASDGTNADSFGASVAASVDTAVVGAPSKDTAGGAAAGAAYVFVRTGQTWGQQQELLPSNAAAGDNFGTSVAVSGDTAFVGAPLAIPSPPLYLGGAVYVFTRAGTTWSEQQELFDAGATGSTELGSALSVDATTALAGAPNAVTPGGFSGAAYAFVDAGGTWSEQQKLVAADTGDLDEFGYSVSVDGDTALIGAAEDTTLAGRRAGSAYVFVRSGTTWSEQQKLIASDGVAYDEFGCAVSLSGNTAVVGARQVAAGLGKGAAYVFVRMGSQWTEQHKLTASDGSDGDAFGGSVSISGDTVLVGARRHTTPAGELAGAAYVFVRSGSVWSEQQELVASDAQVQDYLGSSVAIAGDTAVVGEPFGESGQFAGAAYVFVRSGVVWSQQQKLLAPDAEPLDEFGTSVALSDDTLVVGAPKDLGGNGPGKAYVFTRAGAGWNLQQELLVTDGAVGDQFGDSVALSGDTALVGAPGRDSVNGPNDGAAYVFSRSGTVWTQTQKLVSPDEDPNGNAFFAFGVVSLSGGTALVGAPTFTDPSAFQPGAAYVFRTPPFADLAVSITDSQTSAVPGRPVTYTMIVTNGGPDAVSGALVTDTLPPALVNATWACYFTPGSTCTPTGSGSINDSVTLPVLGTLFYALTATVDPAATGTVTNTAGVSVPSGGTDPDPSNNAASDTDTLMPEADLHVTKSDGQSHANPGSAIAYNIVVSNPGPSDAPGATVADVFPASITGVTWTCVPAGGASCGSASGSGNINGTVSLPAGGAVTFVASGTVDAGAVGTLVNTATVVPPSGVPDPEPSDDSATDVDNLTLTGLSELVHGTNRVSSLPSTGPGAPANLFRLEQQARSSYEIVVDGVTGDIGSPSGSGPLLELLAADAATVLQSSIPAGAGSSRSLRVENASAAPREDEFVRVESAGCTTDCGLEDVYRIRAWDTTLLCPRFNNSSSQITVLVLQNPTDAPVTGHAHFWDASGALAGSQAFTLGPKSVLTVNTANVPGVAGKGGTITVSHDSTHGGLTGKAVAIEPGTGFTFDTALAPRWR
jgi:uncharacterized repeat protein (TIGR01451 family)